MEEHRAACIPSKGGKPFILLRIVGESTKQFPFLNKVIDP